MQAVEQGRLHLRLTRTRCYARLKVFDIDTGQLHTLYIHRDI